MSGGCLRFWPFLQATPLLKRGLPTFLAFFVGDPLWQAVGSGEEGPPPSLPQSRPGTASRPACLDGRRCQSNRFPGRDRQGAFLLRRRRGSAPCGSYAAQLGVLVSRFARPNLLEQCSHRDAASGRRSLRGSLRSPFRTFALKSSTPWRSLP